MDERLLKYKGLIALTKTTEDIVLLEEEISLVVAGLYHTEIYKLDEILANSVRIRVALEIKNLLKQYPDAHKEEVKAILSAAYKTICTLPILRLTLAFEPSEMVINNVSSWARSNLADGIILDLSLDRTLIGGANIVYQGKFYEFSLKRKLGELFEKGDLSLGDRG